MNRRCLNREWPKRLARPPPAKVQTTLQWLPIFWQKTRDGAQLRLDKRDTPTHLRHRLAQVK